MRAKSTNLMKTGGKRLEKMLRENKIPRKSGVWISTYNQSINEDVAGTILCGIDFRNVHYVTTIEDER